MVQKGVGQIAEVWAGDAIAKAIVIRKIKKAGAISEENANKPEELGVHETYLGKMVKLGQLKQTNDGRYYVECKDGKYC